MIKAAQVPKTRDLSYVREDSAEVDVIKAVQVPRTCDDEVETVFTDRRG